MKDPHELYKEGRAKILYIKVEEILKIFLQQNNEFIGLLDLSHYSKDIKIYRTFFNAERDAMGFIVTHPDFAPTPPSDILLEVDNGIYKKRVLKIIEVKE